MPIRNHRLLIHYLLVLMVLMGPCLSLWTAPVLTQQADGKLSLHCALQAMRTTAQANQSVTTDTDLSTTDQQQSPCPALQLSALLAQGMTLKTAALVPLLTTQAPALSFLLPSEHIPPVNFYPARAPPLS